MAYDARNWTAPASRRAQADADCMVLYADGLHVLGQGAIFDAAAIMEACPAGSDRPSEQMRIAPAAPWHPILDRVGSFVARTVARRFHGEHENETRLLLGRSAGGASVPVAWARDFPGRMFRSLLGSAEDFQRPDFVRVALNAIEWAGL